MIEMENQGQNLQHHLLAIGQGRVGTTPALLIDQQKPVPQATEGLAIYSLLKVEGNRGNVGGQGGSAERFFSASV